MYHVFVQCFHSFLFSSLCFSLDIFFLSACLPVYSSSLLCIWCIVKSIYWEININYCLFHADSHFRFFFGVTVYKVISELQKFFSCFYNFCIPSFSLDCHNQTDKKPEDIFSARIVSFESAKKDRMGTYLFDPIEVGLHQG